MQDYSKDSASLPSVILCADELGISLSVLFSFSWFIIIFGIVVEMCNSVEIVVAFLFICIHVGIQKLNKNSRGLEVFDA